MNRKVWNWGHAVELHANLNIQLSSKFTLIGFMGKIWHRRVAENGSIFRNIFAGTLILSLVYLV